MNATKAQGGSMKSTAVNKLIYLLLSASVILLMTGGCSAPKQIGDIEVKPTKGHSVVIGKFALFKNGEKQKWTSTFFANRSLHLNILPDGKQKALIYKVDKSGSFYWDLAPGNYTILSYRLQDGSSIQGAEIRYRFTVPEKEENIYIGDLSMHHLAAWYKIDVEDKFDEASDTFVHRYPDLPKPVKSLMTPEPKPWKESTFQYICSEQWGLDCSENFKGVTALTPDVSHGRFEETDTLIPVFSWEPSSREDVTYDLVIYEAVECTYDPLGAKKDYIKGPIALYEENLEQPTFQLKQPLKKGKKYLWSVRLRSSDGVTSWSTLSHSYFLLFAWGSGYGEWFKFETPNK
ncbi:MAG: hypothetical protein P8Y65_10790 [Campylobacterales bacterium]